MWRGSHARDSLDLCAADTLGSCVRSLWFVIAALAIYVAPANAQTLSWEGVGPVTLGMNVKAAERALGVKLQARGLAYTSDECYETWRADGKDPAIGYVVENGKIAVINIFDRERQPNVIDTHGLGIGATEDEIRRAYGQVKKTPGPYDRDQPENNAAKPQAGQDTKASETEYVPEFWIEVESPDHKRAILFNTKGKKVTWMSTGFKPSVLSAEHCL
jgi:hypothetical protein